MDWLVDIQKLAPWASGLPLLAKALLSVVVLAAAALLLVLIWSTPPAQPPRVGGSAAANPGGHGPNIVIGGDVTHSGEGDINISAGISANELRALMQQMVAGGNSPPQSGAQPSSSQEPDRGGAPDSFAALVARIEDALGPTGAIVRAPDFISDRVTGDKRRVDASIRYKIGSSDILTIIEAYDGKGSDVDWIEHLAQKSQELRATVTVAVSNRGFGEAATRKANFYGIQPRSLAELSERSLFDWLRTNHVQMQISEWSLEDLGIELYDVPPDAEPSAELQDEFRNNGPAAGIFVRNMDGKRFSVENILIEWRKRNGSFFDGVAADGAPVHRTLHQPLERGGLHAVTNRGKFDIKVIHMKLLLRTRTEAVPISRLVRYSTEKDPLVESAEWSLENGLILSLHRDLRSGQTHVRVCQEGSEGLTKPTK